MPDQDQPSTKSQIAPCSRPLFTNYGSRSVDVKPAIRRLKRPSGEREVTHQLTAGRRSYAGTALEASDFPEPIAKSQAAPLTAERKLKKQDPWQVGPVETRLANTSESALWACHTSLSYAKSTTAMRGAARLEFEISWLMQTQGSVRLRRRASKRQHTRTSLTPSGRVTGYSPHSRHATIIPPFTGFSRGLNGFNGMGKITRPF